MRNLRTTTRAGRAGRPAAFTLMEMLVVIGLVSLMAAIAQPSIMSLLNSRADAEAYNLMTSQLTAARALAIETGTFAGIHGQLADALGSGGKLLRPEQQDAYFTGMILYDDANSQFGLYSTPMRVPAGIAFGKLTADMPGESGTLGESADSPYTAVAADKAAFTTLSVVFTGFGSAVRAVNGKPVRFNPTAPVFAETTAPAGSITGPRALWHLATAQDAYATTALTLFNIAEYTIADNDRRNYLNRNAQLLPLNVHTGHLFPRE